MSDAALIALITGIPAMITGILSASSSLNRRTRKRLNGMAKSLDAAENFIYEYRRTARLHNAQFHETDENPMGIGPLPDFITNKEEE